MNLRRASNNSLIKLGRQLGRGGEGAVYPVVGVPDVVAKIYHKPPTPPKVEKLRSMARRASPGLLRVAAWPIDLLGDESGAVRGFLMSRVSAREDVHQLYSPKSRRRAFPGVDFRFVVRAATNVARAFAQVHAVGHVIGDVNHGNALVGRDGTVVLIDCDSFQVRDGARVFTCDVGVPLFTPPELAGQAFRGLRRGANHDNFGLAVLLFHLLYVGRHPFAGKHADGEMPIEQAIAESRFVYGARAAEFGMTRPPGTPELSVLGTDIAAQFERAFAPPSETPRPSATQWVDALQSLETSLTPCAASPAHFFPGRGPGGPDDGAGSCCWCALEHHTVLRVFGEVSRGFEALAGAKLAPLWDAIQAIRRPEPAETLEVPDILALKTRSEDALGTVPRAILSWLLVFASVVCLLVQPGEHVVLALLTFGAAMALRWERMKLGWHSVFVPSDRTLLEARARLRNLTREWNKLVTDRRVEDLLMRLTTLKGQVMELPKTREKLLHSLLEQASKTQLNRYLDTIRLDKAGLPNVSKQEIDLLAHYDIDTAFEVLSRAWGIQGLISNKAHSEIRAWATACSRNFRFDPARGADPEAVQEIDARLLKQQESLLADLNKGRGDLETLAGQILTQRATKQREIDAARQAVSEAESQER